MIDQIIDYNRSFVAQKDYEQYITDKYPDKKLAVSRTEMPRLSRTQADSSSRRLIRRCAA